MRGVCRRQRDRVDDTSSSTAGLECALRTSLWRSLPHRCRRSQRRSYLSTTISRKPERSSTRNRFSRLAQVARPRQRSARSRARHRTSESRGTSHLFMNARSEERYLPFWGETSARVLPFRRRKCQADSLGILRFERCFCGPAGSRSRRASSGCGPPRRCARSSSRRGNWSDRFLLRVGLFRGPIVVPA